ncbi:MAG: TIGR00730 family Rossman fold protein [Oscillospiraceae bacterium]|nr:TIGR00730 family Rossman fold protein [Oscillospiraceae bacterium]
MNICIYGASSRKLAKEYYDAAEALGALMARQGHTLVFGGGQEGIMGAVARGAHAHGGKIIGIAPRFFDQPGILFEECTEFIYTDTMRERKALMEEHSEAFMVLPGGIGTYEEFFEMLTLKQLGRHNKPMVMLNTRGYYNPMAAMLQNTVDEGFMSADCLELYGVCNTPEEALDYILNAKLVTGSITRKIEDYNK